MVTLTTADIVIISAFFLIIIAIAKVATSRAKGGYAVVVARREYGGLYF